MAMASLRYLVPFGFLALLAVGALLGGGWTLAAAIAIALGLAALDSAFGKEIRPPDADDAFGRLPEAYVVLQLAITAWIAGQIGAGTTTVLETIGLTLSTGLATGVFGLSAAHELVHGRERSQRALGLLFLASVFYMHFRIAHIYGHHRRAATFEDPVSARYGESLYAFLARSVAGQFREAWDYEARRQRRAGRTVFSLRNRMVGYLAIEAAIIAGLASVSAVALAFVLVNAALAIVLLETFNYVAHYGLSRGPAGKLGPEHSWNSANRMNNAALFNMGRHSDHHRHGAHPYGALKPIGEAPELPAGYASAMLTALLPPLWRRVMDPRVAASRR